MKNSVTLAIALVAYTLFTGCSEEKDYGFPQETQVRSNTSDVDEAPFSQLPSFSKIISDSEGENSIFISVYCNDILDLERVKEGVSFNLLTSTDNYDQELALLESQYSNGFNEIPEIEQENDIISSRYYVVIDSLDLSSEVNMYGLQTKVKEGDRFSKSDTWRWESEYSLKKWWHHGMVCFNGEDFDLQPTNSVHIEWYRKWRALFRKWTLSRAALLEETGDCDEFYYEGYRIKVKVRTNDLYRRNFIVYQKKWADRDWEIRHFRER